MRELSLKRGLLLSVTMSVIATAPRFVRPNSEDLGYLASHFLYLFILSLINWWFAQYFLYLRKWALPKMLAYLVLCGIFSVAYHRIAEFAFPDFRRFYADFPFVDDLSLRKKRVVLFFRGVAFGAVVFSVEYYFRLLFERQKARVEIERLKKDQLEAQLGSLRQQISPHFLFNSLSTLQTMVHETPARRYIQQLSNVYRYLLAFNENQLATLGEELAFMESYLYILKERFEDALDISIAVDPSLLPKRLPPLALQLLVENAIKHNVVAADEPLHIYVGHEGESLLLVKNRLQPRLSTEKSTGKGLDNIHRRYELLSGRGIAIDRSGGYFSVYIPLLD